MWFNTTCQFLGASLVACGTAHYFHLLGLKRKVAITTTGIGCISVCYWWLLGQKQIERTSDKNSSDLTENTVSSYKNEALVEVIFFPDKITIDSEMSTASREMRGMMYKNILYENATREGAGLEKLRSYLIKAIKSIDICLFNITSEQLSDYVTNTIEKGVKVRLIVDGSTFESSGSQVKKFLAAGAFVRSSWKPSLMSDNFSGDKRITNGDYLMHHKFAIIDESILVTGSFNWTMQALMGNNENIIITTEPRILNPFIEEFTNLWKRFDPKS